LACKSSRSPSFLRRSAECLAFVEERWRHRLLGSPGSRRFDSGRRRRAPRSLARADGPAYPMRRASAETSMPRLTLVPASIPIRSIVVRKKTRITIRECRRSFTSNQRRRIPLEHLAPPPAPSELPRGDLPIVEDRTGSRPRVLWAWFERPAAMCRRGLATNEPQDRPTRYLHA
jgi:hypothetical protein